MRCGLCERYNKTVNNIGKILLIIFSCRSKNFRNKEKMIVVYLGKPNVWCTTGMITFSLDKIKQHKEKSEVHKQTEQLELNISAGQQSDWHATQKRQINKHQQATENLMLSCIFLCQQDYSSNSLEPLCNLVQKLGVTLLPAEVASVSYRNNKAALCFVQHIEDIFHKELVEKIKIGPAVGKLMHCYSLTKIILLFF